MQKTLFESAAKQHKMTVKEAKQQLAALPDDGILMVASLGHGGSVPLQGFIDIDDSGWSVDGKPIQPKQAHWIDVIYCEDHERSDYGLPAEQSSASAAELDHWDEVARSLEASGDIEIH